MDIKDNKAAAFLDFIKSIDFIEVEKTGDSKDEIIANIEEGFRELKSYKEGEVKTTPLKGFLHEL